MLNSTISISTYMLEDKKRNWQITMNSEKSVQSIKKPNTLFPVNLLEDVSLSESDIKEGDKFLSSCAIGEAELVKKFLESFNTSVLNKIEASSGVNIMFKI